MSIAWGLHERYSARPMSTVALPLLLQVFATFAMTVPRHEALRHDFDASAHAALVATNWA